MQAISWGDKRDECDHLMRNAGDPDDIHVSKRSCFKATSEIAWEG